MMNRSLVYCGKSCLAVTMLLVPAAVRAQEPGEYPASRVIDEPAAHALYDQMIQALREAETLTFEGTCRWTSGAGLPPPTRYRIWLKKPNFFRMEGYAEDGATGVLVGDGRNLWIYWPAGKPAFSGENPLGKHPLEETGSNKVYMTKPAPLAQHSILHEAPYIGAQIILDPSIFHGYTDSLRPYLDGVRSLGTEAVDQQPCDLIELSFLHGQRSWKLWLARTDRLPRRIEETVRIAETITRAEHWSGIELNTEISEERFRWRRPMGWARRDWPDPASSLLKSGRQAPDFELMCADGKKRRLSECGEVVWLVFWRFG